MVTEDTTETPAPKAITPEAFGLAQDYFEPRSVRYLVRVPSGRWLAFNEQSYKRHLLARGLNMKRDPTVSLLSDIDATIINVQEDRDISYYGPICGKNSGPLTVNGKRILVTEDMQLPEPAPGEWGNLRAVIHGLLYLNEDEEIGERQVQTFHGWVRSSVSALRSGRIQQQQALALCGPPRCGKSFLQSIITHMLGGRGAKAERYFSGKTHFNGDLYGAEHLILEDEHCSTRIDDRLRLGAAIKQHTVSTYLGSLHSKGRNAINLPGWWRISITLNDDAEAMMVLPPLDQHIADKIILLRSSVFRWPLPMATTQDRTGFHQRVITEIPAYLHWLLNEWEIPANVADPHRYNVATYHHPSLSEALYRSSPEAELHELLILTYKERFSCGLIVEENAAGIEATIRDAARVRAERLFSFRNACGTYLGRLAGKHPEQIQSLRNKDGRWWRIHPGLYHSPVETEE